VPTLRFEHEFFVNRLGSLSKLMTLASNIVETYADDIIDTCIKDILLQCHEPNEGGDEWIDDADLGRECRAKVCTYWKRLTSDSRLEDLSQSIAKQRGP
jgi:hypothetical protein